MAKNNKYAAIITVSTVITQVAIFVAFAVKLKKDDKKFWQEMNQ